MPGFNRRLFFGTLAAGAGMFARIAAHAERQDGHAAGHDVAAAAERMALVPRKAGDPVTFTASLDRAALKSTSGGWAREITARQLPIATGVAGAHLFLNPGGVREMHWHNSAEWACILDGRCQVTVVDPTGETEVANYSAGDLWYFPRGHAHAIQALGSTPCHAILAFDDGLYGEHGTFGLTDWISRLEPEVLAQSLGVAAKDVEDFPKGETYIMQGPIVSPDGLQARSAAELDAARTHRFPMLSQPPRVELPGGTVHVASAREFPLSRTMTGVVTRLQPGAMHPPHWHPEANEWHYVAAGRTRVTLFAPDKRLAVAELATGDCAYLPRGCGHSVQNIGGETCEIVGVHDDGSYVEAALADWMCHAPRSLLAANLGVADARLPRFHEPFGAIVAGP